MTGMVITAMNSTTAVGGCAVSTAAAVRAGIARLAIFEDYLDDEGNPILAARVPFDAEDGEPEFQEARVQALAFAAFARFCATPGAIDPKAPLHLLMGVAHPDRPGPRYEGEPADLGERLLAHSDLPQRLPVQYFMQGNAAAFHALSAAARILQQDPQAQCIVGAVDSLLDETTLDWFELSGRLKSETYGRNQGFPPGEGVGFFLVESEHAARVRRHQAAARILAVGLAEEANTALTQTPTTAEGMSIALRQVLQHVAPESIAAVFSDMNGEFYRAKEWANASTRCFQHGPRERELWHPAEYFGDVGSAWGALSINLGASFLAKGVLREAVLCVASDDHGARGAVALGPV
jgi:3-oxoacyl-[acyl-carrier-protein] synthase-1